MQAATPPGAGAAAGAGSAGAPAGAPGTEGALASAGAPGPLLPGIRQEAPLTGTALGRGAPSAAGRGLGAPEHRRQGPGLRALLPGRAGRKHGSTLHKASAAAAAAAAAAPPGATTAAAGTSAGASALAAAEASGAGSGARLGPGVAGQAGRGPATSAPLRSAAERARSGAASAVRQFYGAVTTLSTTGESGGMETPELDISKLVSKMGHLALATGASWRSGGANCGTKRPLRQL